MFDFLNQSLVLFGNAKNFTTTPLELIAVVLTILSVWGATQLKVSLQYAVGILATATFFFVFKNAGLISSAALQVYFTVIQLYGWWYWLYGAKQVARTDASGVIVESAKRVPPSIGNWSWASVGGVLFIATAISVPVSTIVNDMFNAKAVFWDTLILSFSVLAQFLLDRKQIKTWFVWGAVNVLSIYVYGFVAGLGVSGVLYAILLANVFLGYTTWKKASRDENGNDVQGSGNVISGNVTGNTVRGNNNTLTTEPTFAPYSNKIEK